MPNDERILETMPDGALGLIPLKSCEELGAKVDEYLVGWREKRQHQHLNDVAFKGYHRDSYIIPTAVPVSDHVRQKVSSKSLSVDTTYICLSTLPTTASPTLFPVTRTICPRMTTTLT